jgi:lysophospholipase L1-like esterase
MREGKKAIILVMASTLLILIILETAVRCVDMVRGKGFFSDYRNSIAKFINPFRVFGFEAYQEVNGELVISSTHKELFPVKKGKDTLRIVAFGGSTTENLPVMKEFGKHYPLVIQEQLSSLTDKKVEVINVGDAAYATPHSLILLELDVLSWDPDIVILSHNHNDLMAAYFPGFRTDYSNKYGHPFYMPGANGGSIFSILFQHSSLYWFLKRRIEKIDRLMIRFGDRYEIHRESYGMSPPEGVVRSFERNIVSFIALATNRGIEVVLGTQPLLKDVEYFKRHMGYKPYNDIVKYPLTEEYFAHHQAMNQILRDVSEGLNVWLVDNDEIFNNRVELFNDHIHFTIDGVNLLARNYSDYIQDNMSAYLE